MPGFITPVGAAITAGFIAASFRDKSLIRFREVDDQLHAVKGRVGYQFSINPDGVDVKRAKVRSTKLTFAGWEQIFRQNGLISCSYRGSSGVFRPNLNDPSLNTSIDARATFDLRLTERYQQFMKFDEFYQASGPYLIRMDLFIFPYQLIGWLDDFKFSLNAKENASHITYSFEFIGLPLDYSDVIVELGAAG